MVTLKSSLAVLTVGLTFGCGSSGDTGARTNGSGTGAGGADAGIPGDGSAGADGDGSQSVGGTSGASGSTNAGAGGTGVGGRGLGGASVGGAGTGMGGTGGPVTSVTPIPDANACATDRVQAQGDDLDLFIMQDRSGSMDDATSTGDSKWTVVTTALVGFVNDKQSAGIGAGIGFFSAGTSCAAATYATPSVPIAPLNGNAPAIVTAIGNTSTGGNTPTEPALQGAIDYARAWAQAHPTHKVIVIFATDGLPNGCNSTVNGAATIAGTGVSGTPPISTYVIGVFGASDCPNGLTQQCTVVQNTNAIAKGGGTGTAFIVDTGGNTLQQFSDAMNSIRSANIAACEYTIPKAPTGKTIDPTRATVQYAPVGKTPTTLPWVASAGDCGTADGWYYDDVNRPGTIHVCDKTCTTVQADTSARVEIMLGCTSPGGGGGGGGTSGGGGTNGGGASGAGGTSACLLLGQSCQTGSDCCSGICSTGGICVRLR